MFGTELDSPEGSLTRDSDEMLCPLCYGQSLDLEALIKHVDDEHAYQQRSVVRAHIHAVDALRLCVVLCRTFVSTACCCQQQAWAQQYYVLQRCPVCSKPVRDMLQHLLMHQRSSDEHLCSSPSSQASSSISQSMSTVRIVAYIIDAFILLQVT